MLSTSQSNTVIEEIGKQLLTRDALLVALHEQQKLVEEKQQIIDKKSGVISQQKTRINVLEEYLRLARANRFGPSSEKNKYQAELDLLNEAELLADGENASGEWDDGDDAATDDQQSQKPVRKKRGTRKKLSPNLPRVQVRSTLSEEEKRGAIDTFFVTVKEELDITPAKVQVIEYLQEKAVFVDEGGKRSIKAAERLKHPLGKAIGSVALLSYIIIAKYSDGMPLYRLEGILKRYGGQISRTVMANWLIRLAIPLQALINLMRDVQLSADFLQGDETRIKVLKEPGLDATSHKWMWVMRGGPPDKPVVLFDYDKSRGKAVAKRLLADFEGRYFQSDGYAGYDEVCVMKNITHLGCWDHARRKYVEAEKALDKSKAKAGRVAKATVARTMIDELYRIERQIKQLPDEEKLEQRLRRSKPQLEKIVKWLTLNAPKVAKDSLTRKAMDYTLNQWPKLIRYAETGHLPLSNILAENAIRPFALGRRAWLFADTPAGANASAIYFSLIETAKANGLEPYDYVLHVITNIATADTVEDYEALLPWNVK